VNGAASHGSGIVGGPFLASIGLPKLFEAAQGLRESLAHGPLSAREQQIVNLTVARHWGAHYPWFAQVRRSLSVGVPKTVIEAINARQTPELPDPRERTCHAVAHELLTSQSLSDASYAPAAKIMGVGSLVARVAATGTSSRP